MLIPISPAFHFLPWDNKLSSDDAVKRVLAGEKDVKGRASLTSKPQEPDNRNVREEEPRVPKDEEVIPRRHIGARDSESFCRSGNDICK